MSESRYYKIGVSKNPSKRVKSLQTSCPEELQCLKTFKSEYANKIEKSLHRELSHKGTQGEWFKLEDEYVNNFETNCKRIHELLSSLKLLNNPFV